MGEFSVGHAGFMSLGAYASAVLTVAGFPGNSVGISAWRARRRTGRGLGRVPARAALVQDPRRLPGDRHSGVPDDRQVGPREHALWAGRAACSASTPLTTLPWTFFCVVATLWVIRNLVYSQVRARRGRHPRGRDRRQRDGRAHARGEDPRLRRLLLLRRRRRGALCPPAAVHQSVDLRHHQVDRDPGDGLPRRHRARSAARSSAP